MIVPLAYALSVSALLLLLWHVRQRYRSAPKRVPLRLRLDGRPSGSGPRRLLWVAPLTMVAVLAVLTVFLIAAPPTPDQRITIALVFVIIAEVAWFVGWSVDRQIELARGMTYRVAPARTLRALLPILATIAVTLFLAIRPA
jgi:hypothetical protein